MNARMSEAVVYNLLRLMGVLYRVRPSNRHYLRDLDGWMDFSIGLRTVDDAVRLGVRVERGVVRPLRDIPEAVDTVMTFKDLTVLKDMLSVTPEEVMDLMLQNKLRISGNLATMNKFNFLLAVLLKNKHSRMRRKKLAAKPFANGSSKENGKSSRPQPIRRERLHGEFDQDAPHLDDPYLSAYSLSDFPRLAAFRDIHFTKKPVICHERAALVTDWCRRHGFETDSEGNAWVPELRQAELLHHLLANKKPIIRENDLLAGTTTTEEIGVVLYPDTHATTIWGELFSAHERELNPYDVSEDTRRVLHHDVFPFWEKRNIREWVRRKHGEPLCQQLDERFAVYFIWKTVAISHTIADFPKLLRLGTSGMAAEIERELSKMDEKERSRRNVLRAMLRCLEGVEVYADNLASEVARLAEIEADAERAGELNELASFCRHAPRHPARTLHEALNAIWIVWVALHMENTNAGLSLGRMDQWLQPYFHAEIEALQSAEERRRYIERVVELVGCFYMRCTDHLPLIPDIGNFLFGGSSSDQAITLGGVKPDGSSAVNDMTYVFLKVTELLAIRDPNVNARFHRGVNSETYLQRLCEVNLLTAATPSMHNDEAVLTALESFGYPDEHRRDWAATGCVEPTISGRHMGHTGNIMMNMVAALEMALNNGKHPLMDWKIGPETGNLERDAFATFEDFFDAFTAQYGFLIDQVCEYNYYLSEAHALIRPTPLLSSMIEGTLESGKDVTAGGATYNTTGMACIGLADVTDSLLAIKKLVFETRELTFSAFKRAIDTNFADDPALHARILNRLPKFGSGDVEALAIANRLTGFTNDCLRGHTNFRGGPYTAGFWSMSNHVAFGCLAGALPSGRLAGKSFTPGLTPRPEASDTLLDPIRDVASLNPHHMPNNIAFNVKIMPDAKDGHRATIDRIRAYAKSYFDLGGMQMQFNIVTSDTLRDAMAHPENYPHLLVRISGYNAYFVTLNRDMQLELIERAEYGV